MTKRETFLSNKGKRILFVFFAFILMYLVSYVIDPYASFWKSYFDRNIFTLLAEWLVSLISCLLISESGIAIHAKLNKLLPWPEHPGKRLAIETSLNMVSVLLIIMANLLCYSLVNGESVTRYVDWPIEEIRGLIQWVVTSVIISFVIIAIHTGDFLILNWKNAAMEAAEYKFSAATHKQAATEAELQALKLQIDPHFVFNNLSVLSELILENQQLGYQYAENFSKVYRYLLVNSRKDVILLSDELKFLTAYIFLIEHRVGSGVHFEINVDTNNNNLHVPPLTLQLLVENALKHNKTVKNNPLIIKVYLNNENLVVENTLIPIEKQVSSSGIGIHNIISRYQLLSDRMPEIVHDADSFKVIIPLIKL
ncbi:MULTISPECIES: sensor histidine kinase [Chitinophaga]|uniref:sensor histidine kinase n=1 Tax=Chitinophaga TaxID=79328 RepID=UPI000DB9DCE7|nr:histidine kinase [Chitinophaga ginsengisegetis]MDR6571304.1 sensor histidine kinase YesM [Chitinophaga ginsengisegetis]MDR6651038.1 sensor histidine kinase YesM [Chitinophaga ginsengisegetis]MDR6657388.1 sensor histidine kinase YesM [Chitinophaga ginsengisegetis]